MTQNQSDLLATVYKWLPAWASTIALVVSIFTGFSSIRVEMALLRKEVDGNTDDITAISKDVQRMDRNILVLSRAINSNDPDIRISNEND